jgi:hypothetical protein
MNTNSSTSLEKPHYLLAHKNRILERNSHSVVHNETIESRYQESSLAEAMSKRNIPLYQKRNNNDQITKLNIGGQEYENKYGRKNLKQLSKRTSIPVLNDNRTRFNKVQNIL